MNSQTNVISTVNEIKTLPIKWNSDGTSKFSFKAHTGLYQFSLIMDASQFNWEELYFTIDKFGNKGQRTGPWDFSLEGFKPLVPSYWVKLDGKKLGLWYSQRVSLDDLDAKRFRANMAFYIECDGEHDLEFIPFREFDVQWISARLEVDPEDSITSLDDVVSKELPVARWNESEFWQQQKQLLKTTHAIYKESIDKAIDWTMNLGQTETDEAKKDFKWICAGYYDYNHEHIALLVAAHHLNNCTGALEKALEIIDETIAKPWWGASDENGYGWNGDFHAGSTLRALSMAYRMLYDQLGDQRRERLIKKLTLQANHFFQLALLNRDYWGGSLIQDHGWRAMFSFGTTALHLLEVIPEAKLWCSYIIPRLKRSLEMIPRDGSIPASSYYSPYLYLHELTHYRNALLTLSGLDILDESPLEKVVDYLVSVWSEFDGNICIGHTGFNFGAESFLNIIAEKYQDQTASWMHKEMIEQPPVDFPHPDLERGYYLSKLWGFFSYDNTVQPQQPSIQKTDLVYIEDSGTVYYKNNEHDIALTLECGPWPGYRAYQKATCSCDRMSRAPISGHFALFVKGLPLLATPDTGYRLNTFLGNCLLVDDKGQYGDIGYPMSIPSYRHQGERIETVKWDKQTGRGFIRLDLQPAYPSNLEMIQYNRDIIIASDKQIICRDHVQFNKKHNLSWLFHASEEFGVAIEQDLRVRFGKSPSILLNTKTIDVDLTATIHETDIVWAYNKSENNIIPFHHVRYDSTEAIKNVTIDFIFQT